jgi:hypothetical protein
VDHVQRDGAGAHTLHTLFSHNTHTLTAIRCRKVACKLELHLLISPISLISLISRLLASSSPRFLVSSSPRLLVSSPPRLLVSFFSFLPCRLCACLPITHPPPHPPILTLTTLTTLIPLAGRRRQAVRGHARRASGRLAPVCHAHHAARGAGGMQVRGDGVTMEWRWSGDGVAMEWRWSGDGVVMEWRWSGDGVAIAWRWSGDSVAMERRKRGDGMVMAW